MGAAVGLEKPARVMGGGGGEEAEDEDGEEQRKPLRPLVGFGEGGGEGGAS
jgi:hypothetical protein